jgi:hypothetical protein
VAVAEANLKLSDLNDLGVGEADIVVEVAAHDVHVLCDRLQTLINLLGAQIARAEHVLHLVRHQQRLELLREVIDAVGCTRNRNAREREVWMSKHATPKREYTKHEAGCCNGEKRTNVQVAEDQHELAEIRHG